MALNKNIMSIFYRKKHEFASDKAKALGFVLKDLRENKNDTLEHAAKISGLSKAYICQLEKGKKPNPSEQILAKYIEYLNIDRFELDLRVSLISLSKNNELDDLIKKTEDVLETLYALRRNENE